jgi:hypothetical protein
VAVVVTQATLELVAQAQAVKDLQAVLAAKTMAVAVAAVLVMLAQMRQVQVAAQAAQVLQHLLLAHRLLTQVAVAVALLLVLAAQVGQALAVQVETTLLGRELKTEQLILVQVAAVQVNSNQQKAVMEVQELLF